LESSTKLNHNIDIAIGAVVAARDRAEQGGMRHPFRAQVVLGRFQCPQDLVAFHGVNLRQNGLRNIR
jgi:hypothetical protein